MDELHRDPKAAMEMAINAVMKYLRDSNPPDKQAWIATVFEAVKTRAK